VRVQWPRTTLRLVYTSHRPAATTLTGCLDLRISADGSASRSRGRKHARPAARLRPRERRPSRTCGWVRPAAALDADVRHGSFSGVAFHAPIVSQEGQSQGRRSAFFFAGQFTPAELANFNLQNVILSDGPVVEVLGHHVGLWWGSRPRSQFDALRDEARIWVETIAAAYFVASGRALGVRLTGWVEALDVDVREAVLGFIDDRYRVIGGAPAESDPVNSPLRDAVATAARLLGFRHLQPATLEVWRAAVDPSDEAFLSAFRAAECLRRLYGDDDDPETIKAAWQAMTLDPHLPIDQDLHDVLRDAAKAVRHGDRPANASVKHPVTAARAQRVELMQYATELVRSAIAQRLPA
jgi:hypothetical protein